jgi:GR25 family glycosyltransferase involved in LPS biosynthesis
MEKNALPAVSKTFVINLKYRIDRMEEIKTKLEKLKIPFERFEAVEFKQDQVDPELMKENMGLKLHNQTKLDMNMVQMSLKRRKEITWEKIGRWQSHVQLYLEIAFGEALSYPGPFLVLEDTAYITEDIFQYLNSDFLFKELPKSWEILLVDSLYYTCHDKDSLTPALAITGNKKYCQVKSALGIHGYLIKDTLTAVKLVSAFNTPFPRISDWYFSKMFETHKLIAFTPTTK